MKWRTERFLNIINNRITNLKGLESLHSVGTNIIIKENSNLKSVVGLSSKTKLGGYILVYNNATTDDGDPIPFTKKQIKRYLTKAELSQIHVDKDEAEILGWGGIKNASINEDRTELFVLSDDMEHLADFFRDDEQDFVKKIVNEELWELIINWDIGAGFDLGSVLLYHVKGKNEDRIKQILGLQPDEEITEELVEENEEVEQALRNSYYRAEETGMHDQIYDHFKSAIAKEGITINYNTEPATWSMTLQTNDEEIRELVDHLGAISYLYSEGFREPLSMDEPRYGWSDFSDETFEESLAEELSRIK